MFELILAFIPWVILNFSHAPLLAGIATIVCCWKQLQEKYLFPWASLICFMLLLMIDANANLSLTLIAWGSALIQKPFLIEYARLSTPEMAWKSPLFFKINYILSLIWGALFLLAALSDYPYAIVIVLILGAGLSVVFPPLYQKHSRHQANRRNPFLQGNFAPIHQEVEVNGLTKEGHLPDRFPKGAYMRNGPNPQFEPITYVYPFDGDGMIHAVYFNGPDIDYKNRYVKTLGYEVERRVGHALYGGIKMPLPIDKQYFLEGESDSPFKNGAFIHIVPFAKRLLALLEANPAYELNYHLDTLGLFKAGLEFAPNINAHVKIDPLTSELFAISYDLKPPYLVLHHINAQGKVVQTISIDKTKPTMIHDFVITQHHIIIVDCPVVFDVEAAMAGDSVLQWHEEMGVTIRILSRQDLSAPPQVIHTDAFFVFHFANAYEQDNQCIIDYVRYDYLKIVDDEMQIPGMNLHRMTIDLGNLGLRQEKLNDLKLEFPTINLNYIGHEYRYIYAIHQHHPHQQPIRFDSIIKYDRLQNNYSYHDFGPMIEIGETIFVPAIDSIEEDDGYLIVHAYHSVEDKSYVYILNAKDLTQQLVRIGMPQRVPFGLHGSWVNVF